MSPKLSDLVEVFFKENDLPFYLVDNPMDSKIFSIRRRDWPVDYTLTKENHLGFISDRRGKAVLHLSQIEIDVEVPTFFEDLKRELLLHK